MFYKEITPVRECCWSLCFGEALMQVQLQVLISFPCCLHCSPDTGGQDSWHTATRWVFSTLLPSLASHISRLVHLTIPMAVPPSTKSAQLHWCERAWLDLGTGAMLEVVLLCKYPLHSIWIKKTHNVCDLIITSFSLPRSVGSTELYLTCMSLWDCSSYPVHYIEAVEVFSLFTENHQIVFLLFPDDPVLFLWHFSRKFVFPSSRCSIHH